jgi:uncharacterized protein
MYRLRGHHLLCLPGYRGMGYSREYVVEMTKLHTTLRLYPDTTVEIVLGPDDLCAHFPSDGDCHCMEKGVFERDVQVLSELGLQVGDVVTWSIVEERIRSALDAKDIDRICPTCPWRSYGVCAEGIDRIRSGNGLYPVSSDKTV